MTKKYPMSEIPNLDPAEFDLYRSAKRTGHYLGQKIVDNVLDMGHTLGWVPNGKTRHPKILETGGHWDTIAVMFRFQGTDEYVWFHMVEETET